MEAIIVAVIPPLITGGLALVGVVITNRKTAREVRANIAKLKTTSEVVAAAGITIEDKPEDMPSRPGYKWVPRQSMAGGTIAWIEAESEDKSGTADEPITFTPGMEVYPNYYYTDGTKRYVCLRAGAPDEIGESAWFTEF